MTDFRPQNIKISCTYSSPRNLHTWKFPRHFLKSKTYMKTFMYVHETTHCCPVYHTQGLLLRPSDQDVCREFSVQNARKRPENGSHLAQGDIPDYFKPGLRTELYILHRALTRSWWSYFPKLQTFCPWNVPHIEKEQRPGVREYPWKSWPRLPFFNAQFGWLPS